VLCALRSSWHLAPLQFRPIPLSLTPSEIEHDVQLMHTQLAAQRAALKRASLTRIALPAQAPTPGRAMPVPAGRADAPVPAAYQQPVKLAALLDHQRALAAAAAASLPVALPQQPTPSKLASPSCNAQHQQLLQQRALAGYALA
jgi:hypothetical protein